MKQYDAIIIGFGKAGKTLAIELAKKKWSVAIIECSSQTYGGACNNIACNPIKKLVYEAQIADIISQSDFAAQAAFYKEAIARKSELTALLGEKNQTDLTNYPNITLYTGVASFTSTDTVKVTLADGEEELQGKEIIINTGKTEVMPAIDGIDKSKHVYTTKSLLSQDVLPKHLIIVSENSEGLELASMYAEFGSKVTLIISEPQFMAQADKDIAGCVQNVFEKRGIEVAVNSRPLSMEDTENGVSLSYMSLADNQTHSLEGDAILAIATQKPATKDLNLKAVGVETDESGAVITNNHLHTTLPSIWAMGDVRGGSSYIYLSTDDCQIILNKLFGNEERTTEDRTPVPYCVFIDPPLAHIGITEAEAEQNGYPFKVSRIIIAGISGSHNLKQTDGMMKAIINTDTKRIMGCTLFCDDAIEIINVVNVAMKTEQPYTFLRDFIFTHPSMSETLNELFAIE